MLGIPINESTVGGAVILAAGLLTFLAASLVTAALWVAACEISRRLRARRYDFGPAANRLWLHLDDHLDDYLAANPDLEAGFARLRTAIRNEQHKGDQL